MAVCVLPDSSGVLHVVDAVEGVCSGYWLTTPDDSVLFLERIFDPNYLSQGDYQLLFQTGITLPIICYLTAWAYQTVINFLTKERP